MLFLAEEHFLPIKAYTQTQYLEQIKASFSERGALPVSEEQHEKQSANLHFQWCWASERLCLSAANSFRQFTWVGG